MDFIKVKNKITKQSKAKQTVRELCEEFLKDIKILYGVNNDDFVFNSIIKLNSLRLYHCK